MKKHPSKTKKKLEQSTVQWALKEKSSNQIILGMFPTRESARGMKETLSSPDKKYSVCKVQVTLLPCRG